MFLRIMERLFHQLSELRNQCLCLSLLNQQLTRKYMYILSSQSQTCYFISQVIEAVVNKECEDVLTDEMAKIKVDFKFYDEFNQLAEKSEKKWTALDGKQLQTVLEKLNITRVMDAVAEIDAEGVNELWSVSSENQNHHISSIYSPPSHNLTKASLNKISIVISLLSLCYTVLHNDNENGYIHFCVI